MAARSDGPEGKRGWARRDLTMVRPAEVAPEFALPGRLRGGTAGACQQTAMQRLSRGLRSPIELHRWLWWGRMMLFVPCELVLTHRDYDGASI